MRYDRILCGVLLACTLFATLPAPAADEPKGTVVFQLLAAADNGTGPILDQRKQEILDRNGGKLGSHDWWLWGLTAFDYDNDGDTDLLVSVHGPKHGLLLKNMLKETGKVRFENVTKDVGLDFLVPSASKKPWVWDFDGDGWLDIAGISAETRNPSFFNDKGKRFTEATFSFSPTSAPTRVIDLNGDGHPDLADHTKDREWVYDPAKKVFTSRPFTSPVVARLPADVTQLRKDLAADAKNRFLRYDFHTDRDLNGDGTPDVVMSGFGGYGGSALGRYLTADATGALTDRTTEFGLPKDGNPVLVADLTGSGAADVLVAASPEGGVYTNDGKGRFTLRPGPLTDCLRKRDPYPHKVFVADFNRDGRPDLVVSSPRLGRVEVYENLGGGRFRRVLEARGWDSEPVAVCDIDDDGLLDLVVGGPGNGVAVYLNRTPNPGKGCRVYARMESPNPFAVGARVEAFRAGELGKPGARPYLTEDAHPDATPVFVGAGDAEAFDLRVTFPGGKVAERKGVPARDKLRVTPDGQFKEP